MTQLGQLYEKEKIEYTNQKVREKAIEIAKSLLEDGTEIVKIMKATGLTEEELLSLQNELLTVQKVFAMISDRFSPVLFNYDISSVKSVCGRI